MMVDNTHGLRAEMAYERLRDLIVKGRIAPGEQVTESRMSRRLGVSRTPVRDALARLQFEGFLVPSNQGRRTELEAGPLSARDVRELWQLMGAVEGAAIAEVSHYGLDHCAALAHDLRNINDDLRNALEQRPWDSDRVTELMSRFHVRFMEECAGPRLRQIYARLRPHVERYEWAFGTQGSEDYEISAGEHEEVAAAVASGDGGAARRVIEAHWASGCERTCATIGSEVWG